MPPWEKFLVRWPVILTFGQAVRRFRNEIIAIEAFWPRSPDVDHSRLVANPQGVEEFAKIGYLHVGPLR